MNTASAKIPEVGDERFGDESFEAEDSLAEDSQAALHDAVAETGACTDEDKLALFLQVAEQHRERLMWQAQRVSDRREDAEEIVQEALLRAFRNLSNFRGESKMGTWLSVIVHNVGRERIRRRKGYVFVSLERDPAVDGDLTMYDPPDPGRNPEQLCESRELQSILLSEIDKMNSVCKRTIEMCAFEERKPIDVANALGVNVFTVKSRFLNGKRMLKRAICHRTGMREDLTLNLETTS
jgi:RNA polymerase sigma-70 factor (ECF subfamily)